uniref:Uncharacterized protein n=1 Tax=Rhizophora mucronata TaxID=61149 RepID=A0A2P2KC29_RHIMU
MKLTSKHSASCLPVLITLLEMPSLALFSSSSFLRTSKVRKETTAKAVLAIL